MGELLKGLIYILLALLFIPAMNLSGMISSRMDHRLCELGVRRAYGATNKILFGTGVMGKSVIDLSGWFDWYFTILFNCTVLQVTGYINLFDDWVNDPAKTPFLSFEMLFNPLDFQFCFCALCVAQSDIGISCLPYGLCAIPLFSLLILNVNTKIRL